MPEDHNASASIDEKKAASVGRMERRNEGTGKCRKEGKIKGENEEQGRNEGKKKGGAENSHQIIIAIAYYFLKMCNKDMLTKQEPHKKQSILIICQVNNLT